MSGLIDNGVFPGKEGIIQILKMMPVMVSACVDPSLPDFLECEDTSEESCLPEIQDRREQETLSLSTI